MTDDDVLAGAARASFELEERQVAGQWVWGWCLDEDDSRWPCFVERAQALRWMADRLGRTQVVE